MKQLEAKKSDAFTRAVLEFYNRTLLQQGLITRQEFVTMQRKILQLGPPAR